MNKTRLSAAAIAVAASFGVCTPALADTTRCMDIVAAPAAIANPGVYCLSDDIEVMMATGAAITIASSNVVLDCNGRRLSNAAAGAGTQAVGIYAVGQLDVTVRNCHVTGFLRGIQMSGGVYNVLDNKVDGNWIAGIVIGGDGSTISGNDVMETGGTDIEGIRAFVGIQAVGDTDITDNTVTDVMASLESNGTVYGIYAEQNDGGTIMHNVVRNLLPDGNGRRRGIWNAVTSDVTVWGNIVAAGGAGLVPGEVGIRCGDIRNGASRENTVLGVGEAGEPNALVNCPEAIGDFVNPL